jgi:hypothetical protein
MSMSIQSIRAVILFAIGDPTFRAQLAERPEEALAGFELSLENVMLLRTVTFGDAGITFENDELLEQLIGASAGDGFPGFGAAGWFGSP